MSASVMQQVEEIVGSFRTKYLLPSVSVSVKGKVVHCAA